MKRHRVPNIVSLSSLIPNLITISCLCVGFSSIYLALNDQYQWAVGCILIAMILDGVDGKIARLLNRVSLLGGQLDSLADLVNFGVCPGLLAYFVALKEWSNVGWGIVLLLVISLCFRLARFNVAMNEEPPTWGRYFSTGLPAPAGACIALLPLSLYFSTDYDFFISPASFAISLIVASLLMVSRFPTFLLNKIPIKSHYIFYLLFFSLILIILMVSYFWATVSCVCLLYLGSVFFSCRKYQKLHVLSKSRS